ncbi:hypothetical protein K443DRAFT_612022 [Laccaria amethystina LaAM-08-1]|uniref:Uncharacterized protein n=1 Tax=Laccaria amethystina LaAM-08-1 TaxID=1095629 RepID=A0A0C9WQ12_9AGAR|nr:hypothetical protein K443DRAFT_612022 [Laccaria amethystina LaAM-08-1]
MTAEKLKAIVQELKRFGRLVGVSKRCCPTCDLLLSLWKHASRGESFVTRGAHNTITACYPPYWISPKVLRQMLNHYGLLLRTELLELKERADSMDIRSRSTGSSTLSIGSMAHPRSSRLFKLPSMEFKLLS